MSFILLFYLIASIILPSHCAFLTWSNFKSYATSNNDSVNDVCVINSTTVAVTGYYETLTNDFDVLIEGDSPSLSFLWNVTSNGDSKDEGVQIEIDSNGNIVALLNTESNLLSFSTGQTSNATFENEDFVLTTWDPYNDTTTIHRVSGASTERAYGLVIDSLNSRIVCGTINGSSNLGGGDLPSYGSTDWFVVKFNSNYNHLWSLSFGGNDEDTCHSLAVDPNHNIYLAGDYFSSNFDVNGTTIPSSIQGDALLVKLDSEGNFVWKASVQTEEYDVWTSVATSSNSLFVAGLVGNGTSIGGFNIAFSSSTRSGVVVKYNCGNGHVVWVKTINGGEPQDIQIVGNFLYVVGIFEQTFVKSEFQVNGTMQSFVSKHSTRNGSIYWMESLAVSSDIHLFANSIAVDSTNSHIYIGGKFNGSGTVNNVPISSSGYDGFLAQLIEASPTPRPSPSPSASASVSSSASASPSVSSSVTPYPLEESSSIELGVVSGAIAGCGIAFVSSVVVAAVFWWRKRAAPDFASEAESEDIDDIEEQAEETA